MACTYGGVNYSEGALICKNGKELVCRGGDWKETGYTCVNTSELEESEAADAGKYLRISPHGHSIEFVSPSILACVNFVFPSHPGGMRIYNSCNDCKIVAISWSNGDISREVVQGQSFIDLHVRASSAIIVGENSC